MSDSSARRGRSAEPEALPREAPFAEPNETRSGAASVRARAADPELEWLGPRESLLVPASSQNGPQSQAKQSHAKQGRSERRLSRRESGAIARPRRHGRENDIVQSEEASHRAAMILFGVGVILVCFALVREATVASKAPVARPAADSLSLRRRIDNHMLDAAVEVEASRLEAERNAAAARTPVTEGVAPRPPDVVTLGVPLKTQPYHLAQSDLDRIARRKPERAESAEAWIREGVREDRDALEWEERAQRMFLADFIRNARDAGWDVRVDKDLNVVYRRIEEEEPGARMPQAVRAAALVEVSVPLFAPFCPRLGR